MEDCKMIMELPMICCDANRFLKIGEIYKCENFDDLNISVYGKRFDDWEFTFRIPKNIFYKSFIKPKSVWET